MLRQSIGSRRDNNGEGELPYGITTLMKNPRLFVKALRIVAAVLTMVAQVILACMG